MLKKKVFVLDDQLLNSCYAVIWPVAWVLCSDHVYVVAYYLMFYSNGLIKLKKHSLYC